MAAGKRDVAVELPAELHYLIIDHLADDRAALSRCSLVCRSWTPVARSHLFRSVEVQATASNRRISAFIDLLKTCPDACAYIEDLTLSCDPFSSFNKTRPEVVSLLKVCTIVTMLSKLQRLSLVGVSLQPMPLNGLGLPFPSIPHLRALRITGCHFHDEDMSLAFDAVRMFAAVDELSFGGFWSTEHAVASSATQPSRIAIRHVHFDTLGAAQTRMMSDFLRTTGAIGGSLESLHLTWSTWAEVKEYQRLLHEAGRGLKRLELEPTDQFWERGAPTDAHHWQALGLSSCTQLESLCLHLNYSYLSYQTDGHKCFFAALVAFAHVLAHNPPPSLRRLTLKIPVYLRRGGVDVTQRGVCWEAMDDAIPRLATLTDVTLEVRSFAPLDNADEEMLSLGFRRALAGVHGRGILCVRFDGVLQFDPYDCPPLAVQLHPVP